MNQPRRSPEECAAALAPLTRLAREAGAGEIAEAPHQQAKERLLTTLAMEAALPPRRSTPTWLLVAAALIVAALGALVLWPRSRLGYTVEGAVAASGYVAPEKGGEASVRFSDGTEVTFVEGGRGRVAAVTARGAHVVLEDGAARVHVVHLPGAEWTFEAGPFVVAVTGTTFDLRWSAADQRFELRMIDGSVRVTSPLAPEGVALRGGQRLLASGSGGELRIESSVAPEAIAQAKPIDPPAARAPIAAAAPADSASSNAAPTAPVKAAPSWAQRVASGDFAGVVAEAEARGVDGVLGQASLADLVALGDAARYAGRGELARRVLIAERARFAGSAEARNAAFLLGRLTDDQGSPAAAIALYDQYLAEAPSGVFAAEALGRKMMAVKRSAGVEAARPIAEQYLQRHPQGAHAAVAREIAQAP